MKYRSRNNKVKFDVDDTWPALDLIDAKKQKNLIIGTAWEGMLFTGLRAKNVIEVRWEDIDLDSEWIFPQHDPAKHIYHPERLSNGKGILRLNDCRRLFTTAARRADLPAYIIDQLRGDVEKGVQDIYDQGSRSHADANAITKQIEVKCGAEPASNVVQMCGRR